MSDHTEGLLFCAMAREWQLAHAKQPQADLLDRYRRALAGIASCATACKCCRMHQEIASEALGRPPV